MTDPHGSLPAPTGVPQPFEAPVAPAPSMPAPTSGVFAPAPAYAPAPNPKRPVLSVHGRIAAWLVLAVKLIFIIDRFIPYSSERLEFFFDRFTDVMFWTWLLLDLVIVVFLFLYVRLGIKPLRYVAAAIVLVDYLIILPVYIRILGGDWLITFTPPEWQVGEVVASLRSLFMWVLKWLCVASSFVLVIPDRKASTVSQQGAVPAPGAAPLGYYPHAAAPAQPAAPQGAPVQMPTTQPAPPQGAPVQMPAAQPTAPQGAPVQMPATQPTAPQGDQVQASSPMLAPPSGAPLMPGTPADPAQASE